MGFKDVIQKLGGKGSGNREAIHHLAEQMRIQRIAEERQSSPNERELNRLRKEDREEMIKEQLDFARKKRDYDINHNHNPLDTKNVVAKSEWEVLKEPNQFNKKSNVFHSDNSVLHSDNKIMKSNGSLLRNNSNLMKGGNMFKK